MFKHLFSLLIFSSQTFALVIETPHIIDIVPYVDSDTWVLFDLDNTLFQGSQALGHADWFGEEVEKFKKEGMSLEDAIYSVYPLWLYCQEMGKVQAVEPETVPTILSLQKRGIVVMGLTHRQPCASTATWNQVLSLNMDFKTAPYQEELDLTQAYSAAFREGIIFVGDFQKKGDLLLAFCDKIGKRPKKVVFIDDKMRNIAEMEKTLDGIEYIGFYYTAIQKQPKVYSREVAEIQLQFLDKMISNEEARLLIHH